MTRYIPHHPWKQRRLPGFDYADSEHAYFITIRARPGTAPFTHAGLAQEVIESLHWLRRHRGVSLYAYCLMSDHLHLVLRLAPGSPPLRDVLGAFKRFTTRASWGYGCRGALWQSRWYDHIVREHERVERIGAYILANPVRKGLVEREETYPWSGCPDPW